GALALTALGLAALSHARGPLWLIYGCLFLMGTARAFKDPAASTLLPSIVPPEIFMNGATWSSGTWQLASVLGPALGGLVVGLRGATPVYLIAVFTSLTYLLMVSAIRIRKVDRPREHVSRDSLTAGLRF